MTTLKFKKKFVLWALNSKWVVLHSLWQPLYSLNHTFKSLWSQFQPFMSLWFHFSAVCGAPPLFPPHTNWHEANTSNKRLKQMRLCLRKTFHLHRSMTCSQVLKYNTFLTFYCFSRWKLQCFPGGGWNGLNWCQNDYNKSEWSDKQTVKLYSTVITFGDSWVSSFYVFTVKVIVIWLKELPNKHHKATQL